MIYDLIESLKKSSITGYAAQISFFVMISLIPMISLFLIVFNFIIQSYKDIVYNFISQSFPNNLAGYIITIIDRISENNNLGFNILAIIVLIFTATKAMESIINSLNDGYIGKRPTYIELKKKSIMLVLMSLFVLLISFVLLFFNNIMISFFSGFFNINEFIINILNYVINIILVMSISSLIYKFGNFKKESIIKTIYGSIFFMISWIFMTLVYSWYSSNFFVYGTILGQFSIVFLLAAYIYILSILFIFGDKINKNIFL